MNDRCLFWLAGPPMLPTFYNNNVMLLQTPDYVVLYVEMIHDARIIPLDGRPRLPTDHRQWLGDARGYWDGDTLVVETRNIRRTEANASTGAGDVILLRVANGRTDDTITVTERFTRLDGDTLRYQFTVDDPTQWTQTFSGELPLVALPARTGHLRVRLSRRQLQHREHPGWRAGTGIAACGEIPRRTEERRGARLTRREERA